MVRLLTCLLARRGDFKGIFFIEGGQAGWRGRRGGGPGLSMSFEVLRF